MPLQRNWRSILVFIDPLMEHTMSTPLTLPALSLRRSLFSLVLLSVLATTATTASTASLATEAGRGIEQTLASALQDKRGILLYVGGQTVAGAVTRIEAGQWVELRSQQWGKIIVRLDRIDAIAAP